MPKITGHDTITEALSALDRKEIPMEEALLRMSSVVQQNLDAFQAPPNAQNAGEIGSLLYAHAVPTATLARGLMSRYLIGSYPNVIERPPEPHAVEKGVGVLLNWLKGCPEMAPHHASIQQILTHLQNAGHLARAATLRT